MDTISEDITLSDGSHLQLRTFKKQDIDDVHQFYLSLPQDEQDNMRYDIRNREDVLNRLMELEEENADRLVLYNTDTNTLIAEGVLEPMRYGWMRKTGEIRIRMLQKYENPEVAHFICKEIFLLAARRGFNSLITRVIDGDQQLLDIFKKLNFKYQATQKKQVVDLNGKVYDLHTLTFSLHRMWKSIEESFRSGDFTNREDL